MFCFLAVFTSFPPASQLKPDTCGIMSGSIGATVEDEVFTSGSCIGTLGINALIICGSSRKLRVPLKLDTRDKDIRHVFIQGGNRHLVLVVEVGGRFRVSTTGQSFCTFDLCPEIATQ